MDKKHSALLRGCVAKAAMKVGRAWNALGGQGKRAAQLLPLHWFVTPS